MRRVCAALLFLLLASSCTITHALADQEPQLTFIAEYIRQLARNQHLGEELERQKAAPSTNLEKAAALVYLLTKMQTELQMQIAALTVMQLDTPFDKIVSLIVDLYRDKSAVYGKMANVLSTPLIDAEGLHKAATDIAKLRALNEAYDVEQFKLMPLIAASLLGEPGRLVITTSQRDELVREIRTRFGDRLEAKDKSNMVSAASLLLTFLSQDIKCSDEP